MWALYGAQIGMTVGGLIDPPKGPTINGPRLSDLSVQTSTYGANISRIYGTVGTMGNVFWLEGNKLKETSNKHNGVRTYSYFATFAVGLCKGPIGGVRRIWLGPSLIYDANNLVPTAETLAGFGSKFSWKVYNGDDTQEPDPRIQADRGVANTPAYRGLAYIVFYDLKLRKLSNSLTGVQVKVEIAQSTSTTDGVTVYDLSTVNTYGTDFAYNPVLNEIWDTQHSPNGITRINADTGAVIGHITTPGLCYGAIRYIASLKQMTCASTSGLYVFNAATARYKYAISIGGGFDYLYIIDNGGYYWWDPTQGMYSEGSTGTIWKGSGGAQAGATNGTLQNRRISDGYILQEYGIGVAPLRMVFDNPQFRTDAGRIWMIRNGTTGALLSCFEIGQGITADYTIPNDSNDVMVYDSDRNSIWLQTWSGIFHNRLTEFDIATRTFKPQITLPYQWTFTDAANPLAYDSLRKKVWVGTSDGVLMGVDTSTGVVTQIETGTAYGIWTIASIEVHNGIVWLCDSGFGKLAKLAPNSQVASTVTLGSIVSAECLMSGVLTAADIDVTALASQQVRGYRVTQTGAIRGSIEPLRSAWPFDIVPAGYKIKFVPRGTASVATIPAADLDARDGESQPGTLLPMPREMDTQLPRRMTLKYLDVEREYDTGEQSAERLNTASINVQESELSIVLSTTEGAQIAERLLYMYWLERTEAGPFRLPPTYLGLEPADVVTVNTSAASYQLRLGSVNYLPDGRLECTAKLDSAALYTPAALGEGGDSTGAVVELQGPTHAELMDIPLLRQQDSMPGFYAAMIGYLSGWSGGTLYVSPYGDQSWEVAGAVLPPGSGIGSANNSIGAGRTDIVDTASSLAIDIQGTLVSVTESQLFAGQNLFAYGVHGRWEIIGAKSCVQQGDGSWVLTDLLRGRFGTEWAMSQHAVDDLVILLDLESLAFVTMESSGIGLGRLYRAITGDNDIDSDYDTAFTYRGVNLECLSPVYLNGDRHPSTNDWTLTWIPRTRYGGEWRDYVDVTLAETTESYEIDIFSDSSYTTLKRTLTSSSPTVAYSSANQVTDFGSNQTTLWLKVYQLSGVVGRGTPLTTSITR